MLTSSPDLAVLFVVPPGGLQPAFREHLGVAFLRAMLQVNGIASELYWPPRNPSLAEFADDLRSLRPRAVGFTVYDTNVAACRSMAACAQSVLPDSVVIVGGPSPTFSPEQLMDFIPAHVCMLGSGEGTIVKLMEGILGASGFANCAQKLHGIENLVLRHRGELLSTAREDISSFRSKYFKSLDDLPSPYSLGLLRSPDAGILTSRGCNQHCVYCSFAEISARKVAFHGVERVLDDVERFRHSLVTSGAFLQVPIFDDAFSLLPSRAQSICEGITKRRIQLPFTCTTRADRVNSELLRAMKAAGFVRIAFGLESAVPRVLRAIGKVRPASSSSTDGFEPEELYLQAVKAAVRNARAAGIKPSVSIIGGLPTETPEDLSATLQFVKELEIPFYSHNILAVMPGTPLFRTAERYNISVSYSPATGTYRTIHAFEPGDVPALARSSRFQYKIREARTITDALCGRPRVWSSTSSTCWSVIHHGIDIDIATLSWLKGVLPIGGTLIAIGRHDRPVSMGNCSALVRRAIECGLVLDAVVVLEHCGTYEWGSEYRSVMSVGKHRILLVKSTFRGAKSIPALTVDADGDCTVPILVPGGASFSCDAILPLSSAGAQLADGCRLWGGWGRCGHARVIHVCDLDDVRACWNGPTLGRVGDSLEAIRDVGALSKARGQHGGCGLADSAAQEIGSWQEEARTGDIVGELAWRELLDFPEDRE